MPTPTFPIALKPVVSRGYSFGAPNNVIEQPVAGGVPLFMLDYATGPVSFNVVLLLTPLRMQVWQDFYFAKIASGSAKFEMELDSGNGLETHVCNIVPSSLRHDTSDQKNWVVTFTLLAETTPAQAQPFEGNLVDLYDVYGDDLTSLLAAIEALALTDLPVIMA